MLVEVNADTCQNYGQCVFVAPDVFDLDDDGELVYRQEVPDSARADVEAAAAACPVQAIQAPR